VKDIQTQIKAYHTEFDGSTTKKKLCTARGGWQSISPSLRTYKSKAKGIHINLFDILGLEQKNTVVHVEPMVNMGQLSHYLVAYGLTIPVLPEMDDLTVGGLFMGVGIETSSHKYGLFNDSVVEAEVVLADGNVVFCSKTQNRELFDALPWSYGTLGFLVSAKIKVIASKPFVRLEYLPFHSQKAGVEKFTELSGMENPPDFVESLQFSRNTMVVMAGTMVDEAEARSGSVNAISRWYKPWFYKYVAGFLETGDVTQVDYIPLRDYFHRHTKSIFWELEQIIPWGNNPVFRFLLGWAVPPKVSFLKLTQTEAIRKLYETQHVIQDMLVPITKMDEALDKFHDSYELFPLWLCPYRAYSYKDSQTLHRCFLKEPLQIQPGKQFEMYVDLGAYGIPKAVLEKKEFDIVKISREVEHYIGSIHGFQMLYADSYMTKAEFRAMFNHSHYDEMKSKYDPDGCLPQVYEKVCKSASWDTVGVKDKKA